LTQEVNVRSKIILTASTFLLFAAGGAMAADVVEAPPPAPVAEIPIFTWTGPYLGIQGGYAWGDASLTDPDILTNGEDFNGGMLGGFIGYNWQAGSNFVLGAEADINALWNDQTYDFGGVDLDVGSDYLASIRGRLGYAVDRALIFATGGVAFTNLSADATIAGPLGVPVDISASEDFTGWTIGAGIDYAFTDNWFGRLEYRYYDFGDKDLFDNTNFDLHFNTVTVGVAYKW
jgi:outer membrane immunogenic protein